MPQHPKQCHYVDLQGHRCSEDGNATGHCYWHDDTISKTGPEVKAKLEAWSRTGKSMAGFKLKGANLAGVKLVLPSTKEGLNLSEADLYRADLSKAHLFHVNMQGCSLMKANLQGANLNCANLENTNILGTEFDKTKVENVHWGANVIQETKGRQAFLKKDRKAGLDYFEQAEEVYRNLRKLTESRGLFENAGTFFHHEMTMRRLQMPLFSVRRFISKLVDIFCGYGEKPINVILLSLVLIFICAGIYFLLGITGDGEDILYQSDLTFFENLHQFFYCLYFSVVTFTTLGYGDFSPIGWSRLIASSEAFMGSFILALFVVVFVKKMTR